MTYYLSLHANVNRMPIELAGAVARSITMHGDESIPDERMLMLKALQSILVLK